MWITELMQLIVLFLTISKIACELEAPSLVSVEAIEPSTLYVTWSSVAQRLADPDFGYKIRIYEIPESSESKIKLTNAEEFPAMVRTDEALEKFSVNSTIPSSREIKIDRETTTASIDNIKYNTLYEVRVLAFNRNEDGPLSGPMRIKTLKDTDYRAVVTRTLDGCQVSVSDQKSSSDETYPFVYNSYY